MAGNHHHLSGRDKFLHPAQGFQTIHLRHPNIQNHEVRGIRAIDFQRLKSSACDSNLIAFVLQNTSQGRPNGLLIIYDQNRC